MPTMPRAEQLFCRSVTWRRFTTSIVLPWALQGVPPTGKVLEIGGGSGAMAAAIAQKYPSVELTVTDYDPTMVDEAAKRLSRHPQVTVRQADATNLPFEDSSFDTVVSFIMLHHVGRWEQAVTEAARVLRPGGVFVGYDLASHPLAKAIHRIERAQHLTCLGKPDELRAALISSPFTDISVEVKVVGLLVKFRAEREDVSRL